MSHLISDVEHLLLSVADVAAWRDTVATHKRVAWRHRVIGAPLCGHERLGVIGGSRSWRLPGRGRRVHLPMCPSTRLPTPCIAIACGHDELASAYARNRFYFTRSDPVSRHLLPISMGRHVPVPSVFEHRRCMAQTRRIQQRTRLALEINGVFCAILGLRGRRRRRR